MIHFRYLVPLKLLSPSSSLTTQVFCLLFVYYNSMFLNLLTCIDVLFIFSNFVVLSLIRDYLLKARKVCIFEQENIHLLVWICLLLCIHYLWKDIQYSFLSFSKWKNFFFLENCISLFCLEYIKNFFKIIKSAFESLDFQIFSLIIN